MSIAEWVCKVMDKSNMGQLVLLEKCIISQFWILSALATSFSLFRNSIGSFNFYCAHQSAVKLLDINNDIVIGAVRLRFNCQSWVK